MTRWRKTIEIKQFLSDDDSPENARTVAGQIAAVLKRQAEYREEDWDFCMIAEDLADMATSDDATCADLNLTLDDLYDWADVNRVWIGGEPA